MTKAFDIVVIAFVLLVQVMLVLPGPVNLAKEPYRRQERDAALKAATDNPSPVTKAGYEKELRMVSRYVMRRQLTTSGVLFAALLVLDAFGLYYLRRYRKRNVAT